MFATFIVFTIIYAVVRVLQRTQSGNSEIQNKIKKRFKGVFEQDEDNNLHEELKVPSNEPSDEQDEPKKDE